MPDAPTSAAPTGTGVRARIDRYFEITRRGSTYRRETIAGLTTFAMMAYIVVLNPLIIGTVPDAHKHLLGITPVAGVTALVAAVMTILMGVVGRVPFGLATGLGLNAFVAFNIASQMSWPEAMGLVVIEGALIALAVVTGLRQKIFRAIPDWFKAAIAVGIGLFIAFIGLVDGGLVRPAVGVPVQLGSDGSLHGWPTVVFLVGLLLTGVLAVKKVRGGILLGIIGTTVFAYLVNALAHPGAFDAAKNPTGWKLNTPTLPHHPVATPDLHLVGHFSFGAFGAVGFLPAALLVFTLILADFFDVMGTTVALGSEANLLDDDGHLPRLGRVLFVDGVAAVAGGASSASSATTYIESSSGIADGARTGFASVITGLMFLVSLFLTPLVSLVPAEAADSALVIVGVLMMSQLRKIDWTDLGIAIPAFLTAVLMPFTYSITNGIGAGLITYVILAVAQGKARKVHPLVWGIAVAFLLYFAEPVIKTILGIH